MELDPINYVAAQRASISYKLDRLHANHIPSNFICQLAAENHPSCECQMGIPSIHQALNKTIMYQIINITIHIQTCTTTDEEITPTTFGAIIKDLHLNRHHMHHWKVIIVVSI